MKGARKGRKESRNEVITPLGPSAAREEASSRLPLSESHLARVSRPSTL